MFFFFYPDFISFYIFGLLDAGKLDDKAKLVVSAIHIIQIGLTQFHICSVLMVVKMKRKLTNDRLMSDYNVNLVKDNLQEFNVKFIGPEGSK